MSDVHTLPAPSIPDGWDAVDTSIDHETPELLSDEQFDRYIDTLHSLLRAAHLDVRVPDEHTPATLEVTNPATGRTVELDLREDRSAEWSLTASDELPPGTSTCQVAQLVAAVQAT